MPFIAYLHQEVCDYCTHLCKTKRITRSKDIFAKETAADVTVGVRSCVVTVQVEQTIVLILIIVTTAVQHNTGGIVVAVAK